MSSTFVMLLASLMQLTFVTGCSIQNFANQYVIDVNITSNEVTDIKFRDICQRLCNDTYVVSELTISDQTTNVQYLDGHTETTFLRSRVSITVVTEVERNLEQNVISDTELQRVSLYASQTCDYVQEVSTHYLHQPINVGVVVHDPISGTRIVYNTPDFTDDCSQLRADVISFGAYDAISNLDCTR